MPSQASQSGQGGGVDGKTIRIFTSHEEANLAAANLRARDIHCWLISDDAGGVIPSLSAPGGVRLLVRPADATAAITLLTEQEPPSEIVGQNELSFGNPSPETAPPQRKLALGQIFLGIVIGALPCLFYQWGTKLGKTTLYHYARNGVAAKAWIYQDNHLVERLEDRNLDGVWDRWGYYDHGEQTRVDGDNNFDGKVDETWTYSNGMLVKMEKDTDFNGTPDAFYTYTNGLPIQADIRPNGAKFVATREFYENGVLVEILRGGDTSGHFKEAVRYDPFFNPVSANSAP